LGSWQPLKALHRVLLGGHACRLFKTVDRCEAFRRCGDKV